MKHFKIFKTIAALALALTAFAGCTQKEFQELTELNLSRCLEPQDLAARVNSANGREVTFSWTVNKDADTYNLVVCTDEAMTAEALNLLLEPGEIPYTDFLPADQKYWFKIQALSDTRDPSPWVVYDGSIKTYAVSTPLFVELSKRTANSIAITWSTEEKDSDNITHIEAAPVFGGEPVSHTLTAAEIAAGKGVVDGLQASTEYQVTLFYLSASRGSVDAWTTAAVGSATVVASAAELQAALAAEQDVYLSYAGSPYDMGAVTLTKGVRIIGESDADGKMPVVKGDIVLAPGESGELYIENIEFDGTGRGRVVTHASGVLTMDKISIVGCKLHDQNDGIFYQQSDAGQLTLGELRFEGCEIYGVKGTGGDGFDVRKNAAIGKLTMVNNTFYDGFRAFIRIDDSATSIEEVVFENNTVKNVAVAQKGLFYIRAPWSKFTIRKNLFLYEDDGAGASSVTVFATMNKEENMPSSITASENYYYVVGANFFEGAKNFSATQLGMSLLKNDPCYNSKGNFFHLNNDDLAARGIGASPWWIAYVEKTEDLTQHVVAAPHVWNLADASLFAGEIKNSRVRDELLIVGSEQTPIVASGALEFTKATTLSRGGSPVSGYLAFKVDGPGSVDIAVSNGSGSTVYAALSDDEGFSVKGGVVPTKTADVQKIVIDKVTGAGTVYLYTSGPVTVNKLAWSADVLGLASTLATPKPVVEPVTVSEGDATEVYVSWDAVPAAASYVLTFNKKPVELEEGALSYTVPAEMIAALEAGLYNFTVTACPPEDDIYYVKSDAGVAAFAVQPKGGEEEAVEKHLIWDFTADYVSAINVADNQNYLYDAGSVSVATSFADENLYFSPNGKAMKSNAKACSADEVTYQPISYAGAAAYMFVHTAKSGKLIVTASVGKSVTETGNCKLGVRIGDNTVDADVDLTCYDPSKPGMDAMQYEWNITNDSGAAQDIRIIKPSGSNSPWIFKVEFVYTETAPAEVEYKWNFTDDYVSAINVADNQNYLYEAGSVSPVTSLADENLYFSPNGKAMKSNAKVCSADEVTYQPISYGGAAAYMFVHTAKSGKLKVKATVGKSVTETGNCKLGVRIGDNTVGADVDLTCYDPSKPGMDAVEYEWDITNDTGAAQDIRIIKPSGNNSPWIFEVSFVAK